MLTSFTKKYSKDSSEGQLLFSFYCDICSKEYTTLPLKMPEEKGFFLKWKAQKADNKAFEMAQTEAKEHFSCCPVCNRWVCDDCFRVLPSGDICKECAEKMENGDEPG